MAKDVTSISLRAYAAKLKISDKAVRDAVYAGKIKKGVAYVPKKIKGQMVQVPVIIENIADKEWGHMKKIVKPQSGVNKTKLIEKLDSPVVEKSPKQISAPKTSSHLPTDIKDRSYNDLLRLVKIDETLSFGEVTRRSEILEAALKKMKLQQMQDLYVEKALIDKKLYELGSMMKTNFHNIPSRVISLIRSSNNDVDASNILIEEINQVLEQLSAF